MGKDPSLQGLWLFGATRSIRQEGDSRPSQEWVTLLSLMLDMEDILVRQDQLQDTLDKEHLLDKAAIPVHLLQVKEVIQEHLFQVKEAIQAEHLLHLLVASHHLLCPGDLAWRLLAKSAAKSVLLVIA